MEKKNLTVQEAADMLNVRRERIWKLMNEGLLTAHPSKLDGRQKLIPREQVEALFLEEGSRPRRTVGRRIHGAPEPENADAVGTATRPWPRSIGMVSDGTLSSSASEAYMRERLHGEPVEAE